MAAVTDGLMDGMFKDAPPIKTVERIKAILKQYDIETEVEWNESSVPYCYSNRISIRGTVFGTNGKGLTPEFALASGYGELMERLQLGYVNGGSAMQKTGDASLGDNQNERVSGETLLERNKKWYEIYSQRVYEATGTKLTAKAILNQYIKSDGSVMATPYYCLTTKSWEYLPTVLRKNVYSANGCAAGNTMEEAVVQAISEIIERQFKLRALSMRTAFPEIPQEVLRSCKVAYEIISFLRQSGFKVVVKDVSMGTKFPVICVCLIDERTGRYHTHFGAYPIFEIALERTLTETFQGRNIEDIAAFDDFCYKEKEYSSIPFLMKELVKGTAEKMPHFFLDDAAVAFNENVGFKGKNNKELYEECIRFISDQGYDILLRDCSCLGFPTYQVIVPGYSEVYPNRLSPENNDLRYGSYVVKALRNPPSASFDDILGLMLHITDAGDYSRSLEGFSTTTRIPAKLDPNVDKYLMNAAMAYNCYALGKYSETIRYVNGMIRSKQQKDMAYLICLKRYISMVLNQYEETQIRRILECFHSVETIQRLYKNIANNGNPLADVVLRCDMKCSETCQLNGICRKKQTDRIQTIINSKYSEIDRSDLEKKIQDLCF